MELKCWRAIARYGLYKEKPTDAKVDMLMTQLYKNIDYSQARREDGFRSGRSQTYDYKAIQRMREEGTVSYTHLDVYKRQGPMSILWTKKVEILC